MTRPFKIRALTRQPLAVASGAGITNALSGGTLTTSLNIDGLTASGAISPSVAYVAIYDTGSSSYKKTRLDEVSIPAAASRTPRGDANYSILTTDRAVALTAALTAPRTWTLPAANTITAGAIIEVVDEAGGIGSTNTLTLACTGADKINNASTLVLASPRKSIRFICDGSSKFTLISALGANDVVTSHITDANVTTAKIADSNVTTAKIADANVTAVKMAGGLAMLPLNFGLAASAASSALTITLTDAAGSTPSATSAVVIPFRSVTATTGTVTTVNVTAATTLVISSGSTLGIPSSKPCKVHVVAFNDAGTIRLGAIVCKSTTKIMGLAAHGIASSTAEGGAGAADSVQTFYTGTAVSSKAYCYLGYFEWSSGLTAGTWVVPTTVQPFGPGVPLPGQVIQSGLDVYRTNASTTSVIPIDDTIPQVTEGAQFASVALSPQSLANVLMYSFAGVGMPNTAHDWATVALFLNGAADAIDSTTYPIQAIPYGRQLAIVGGVEITASGVQTITARFGPSANSMRMNGTATARYMGGSLGSALQVMEIAA